MESDAAQSDNSTVAVAADGRTPADVHADHIASLIKECIRTASTHEKSFAAVKVTGMGATASLKNLSGVLAYAKDLFKHAASASSSSSSASHETTTTTDATTMQQQQIGYQGFRTVVQHLPGYRADQVPETTLQQWFQQADVDKDGQIDWVDFSGILWWG